MYGARVEARGGSHNGRYKYQRLRERLRDAIRTGELTGKLPGERELARRYNANAKTINKALADLSIEGVLIRHVGRGTFVAGADATATSEWNKSRTFGWLDVTGAGTHRQQICRMAGELLMRKGHRIECLMVEIGQDGVLDAGVLTPGNLRSWDGVVLSGARPGDDFVAELHRRHLPVVVVNNCHDRIKSPTVLPDYSQGIFELCQHLIQLGHRKLQLLLSPALLPAGAAGEMGYRAAVQRYELPAKGPMEVRAGFDWEGLLSGADRPTAIICVGGTLAAEVAGRAAMVGLKAPSLSIACLPEAGDSAPLDKAITSYDVPVDAVAYWAAELLLSASPGQAPRVVIVPGRVVERGSTAPPRGERNPS